MKQYRETIGWGAIVVAALNFIPVPLPTLPPMLLFAAGIGLVKGWDGGRKLFVIWAAISGLAALAGLQYDPVGPAVDLAVIGACLAVVLWGDWRRLLPH